MMKIEYYNPLPVEKFTPFREEMHDVILASKRKDGKRSDKIRLEKNKT